MIQTNDIPIVPLPDSPESGKEAFDALKGLSIDDAMTKIANSMVDFAFKLLIAILVCAFSDKDGALFHPHNHDCGYHRSGDQLFSGHLRLGGRSNRHGSERNASELRRRSAYPAA